MNVAAQAPFHAADDQLGADAAERGAFALRRHHAIAGPFQDSQRVLVLPLAKMRVDFAQEMRRRRRPRPEIAQNLAIRDRQEVCCIDVIELVDLAPVGPAQRFPVHLVDEDLMAQPEGLFEQRAFARQHAGDHLDHIGPLR